MFLKLPKRKYAILKFAERSPLRSLGIYLLVVAIIWGYALEGDFNWTHFLGAGGFLGLYTSYFICEAKVKNCQGFGTIWVRKVGGSNS
ncbi:MAG: hypothetical protein J6R79_05765 [Bacteroidaceae bacterium]|nr:hypothetical protein [Bacteroidaceae bacterium]